jgi:hypothetical protein
MLGKTEPAGKDTTAYTVKFAAPGAHTRVLATPKRRRQSGLMRLQAQLGTGAKTKRVPLEIQEVNNVDIYWKPAKTVGVVRLEAH